MNYIAKFFKHDFSKGEFRLYDKKDKLIFIERSNKYWEKRERDENGKITFLENSDKYWIRYEYDENGNITFSENSNKFWARREFDENGNVIFLKDSNGSTFGTPKSQEVEMTVRELQDLVSEQKGINVKLKIKE